MRLIPVLDVQQGHAVHAVGGLRKSYRRLQTPMSASTTFQSVADALRSRFAAPELYVADLDAIEGHQPPSSQIFGYAQQNRGLSIWLDCGARNPNDLARRTGESSVRPVIATETLADVHQARSILAEAGAHAILSLDFKDGALLGRKSGIFEMVDFWPSSVIVMTLDHVGRNEGPDVTRVAEIKTRAGDTRAVFAAGGVRHIEDLKRLAEAGASGALIASALHTGKIKPGDLEEIAGF